MGFVLPFPYVGQKEVYVNQTFVPAAVLGGGQSSAFGEQSLATIGNSIRVKESLLVLDRP